MNDQANSFKKNTPIKKKSPTKANYVNTSKEKISPHESTAFFYSPLHFFTATIGFVLFFSTAITFIFGCQANSILSELAHSKRVFLAASLGSLAGIAVFLGFKGRRKFAFLLSVALVAGLCSLPIYYQDTSKIERKIIQQEPTTKPPESELKNTIVATPEPSLEEKLKNRVLIKYFKAFEDKHSSKNCLIYLVDSVTSGNISSLEEFITSSLPPDTVYEFSAAASTEEEPPAYVFFFAHSQKSPNSIDSLFQFVGSDIQPTALDFVYHVKMNQAVAEKLPESEEINQLTILEKTYIHYKLLDGIVLDTQLRCLKFIQNTDTLAYASDILYKLNRIMSLRDLSFKKEVVKALHNWIKLIKNHDEKLVDIQTFVDQMNRSVIAVTELALNNKQEIPLEFLNYLTTYRVADCQNILFKLWLESPISAEPYMLNAGTLAEDTLEPKLHIINDLQLIFACEILAKIGTSKSLPQLKSLWSSASQEKIKSTLRSTIDDIEKRH